MADKLELKVVFSAVDKFLRPVGAITKGAKEASQALKLNEDRIRDFNSTVAKIDAFKKVERDSAITANSIKSTAAKIAELRAEIAKTGAPTDAQAKKLDELRAKSHTLSLATDKLKNYEADLGATLRHAGVDTKNLVTAREHLVAASASELMMSRKLQAALDVENKKRQQLAAAQARMEKSKEFAGKLAGTGAKLTAGGAAMSLPVGLATKAYADFETAMLGVARQVDGARDANGRYTATYFEMGSAIKAMSEKLPMTANEIAAIVEAGARMGIQGKQNLLTFTETTAVMASAFNLPVDQIGEDIGKISQLYKVPMKDIKALGDTINFLDDNALAKGGDIIDVMKRIAGTADMVKMNFKDAAALGSTFLSLGAQSEVAASASNAMIRELSIATMQSKRFMGGLDMLKLKAGDVQLGMNKDATGTILKVLEAIKKLPEQKQLEAATRLFGKEFGDDAAKLASNMDEYRRQLALVNDEKAKGSMQRESDTRSASVNARMAMAKNALTNITSDLGETLRPALVETLERTLSVVQGVRAWAKENPQLAAGLMTVAKYLALGATVLGVVVLAAAAVLGPLAMIKFGLTAIGLSGVGMGTLLTASFGAIKAGVFALGRALLMNPIGLTITAIAAGAFLIYKYWDPIKAYFGGLWDQIKQAFNGGLSGISALILNWSPIGLFYKAFASVMSYFGIELPGKFSEFGGNLMSGLGRGILDGIQSAKNAIGTAGDAVVAYFKEKLGIHSPSRVFAELGGFAMQGLELGITSGSDGPLSAISAMAKKLAGVGAGIALGSSVMASDIPINTRPPLSRQISMSSPDLGILGGSDGPLSAISAMANKLAGIGSEIALGGSVTDNDIPIDTRPPASRPTSMNALDLGILGGSDGPLSAISAMSKKLAGIGSEIALGGSAMGSNIPIDTRPPVSRPTSMSALARDAGNSPVNAAAGNTYQIYITAAPGTESQNIAALVAREIERIESKRAAQQRGRLRDAE